VPQTEKDEAIAWALSIGIDIAALCVAVLSSVEYPSMAKCTPSFDAMIAARGGRGMNKPAPGKKAPAKTPKPGK
jgi:hypothetical protein